MSDGQSKHNSTGILQGDDLFDYNQDEASDFVRQMDFTAIPRDLPPVIPYNKLPPVASSKCSSVSEYIALNKNRSAKKNSKKVASQALEPEQEVGVFDAGQYAIWNVSSAKPGCGVDKLFDDNIDTYWQSDGTQPHFVSITFSKLIKIRYVCIYVNIDLDESYTPDKISVKTGNEPSDMKTQRTLEVNPNWWEVIELQENSKAVECFMIQIFVMSNHQHGRDSHIRQIKVYAENPQITLPQHKFDLGKVKINNREFELPNTPSSWNMKEFVLR